MSTPPPSTRPVISVCRCFNRRRDVTDVFEAFHREPKHRAKLEVFRVGTLVGYTPSALVTDFRSLKQEIDDEGLFEVNG